MTSSRSSRIAPKRVDNFRKKNGNFVFWYRFQKKLLSKFEISWFWICYIINPYLSSESAEPSSPSSVALVSSTASAVSKISLPDFSSFAISREIKWLNWEKKLNKLLWYITFMFQNGLLFWNKYPKNKIFFLLEMKF